ncbi:DUF6565 domain-containing protein [Saccharicrinis sp. FJH54]|uniref:DUF6565 domain-containing protein n=1 Tax=Saccharicrinis sp. FJH54 TaxID=3344665 RepID=UPI0035D4302C
MKATKVFFVITVFLISVMYSCSFEPGSKDAYLSQFNDFVENVGNSYKDYTDETWEKKDKQFSKYTDEWYMKFKDELNVKEQITVKKLAIKYALYRNGEDLKGGLEEGIKALKELGEEFLKILDTDTSDEKTKIEISIE